MTNAEKFLQALTENEEIRKYLSENALEEGTSKEDGLVAVAEKFGYDITKEELIKAFNERAAQIKASKTEAEDAELKIEDLEAAAGGKGHSSCKDTYKNEKENCWSTDRCDLIVECYWGKGGGSIDASVFK